MKSCPASLKYSQEHFTLKPSWSIEGDVNWNYTCPFLADYNAVFRSCTSVGNSLLLNDFFHFYKLQNSRSLFRTVVFINVYVIWDVTPCWLVNSYIRSGGSLYRQLEGQTVQGGSVILGLCSAVLSNIYSVSANR